MLIRATEVDAATNFVGIAFRAQYGYNLGEFNGFGLL